MTARFLKKPRPEVTDVIPPDVARTMVAMLEDVVQFGTGVRAKELGRPSAGRQAPRTISPMPGTSDSRRNDHRSVGGQRRQANIARQKRNRRARRAADLARVHAGREAGTPVQDFPNVVPLEKRPAGGRILQVDTPDTAPPADAAEQGLTQTSSPAKTAIGPPSSSGSKPLTKGALPPAPLRPTAASPTPPPQKISTPAPASVDRRNTAQAH